MMMCDSDTSGVKFLSGEEGVFYKLSFYLISFTTNGRQGSANQMRVYPRNWGNNNGDKEVKLYLHIILNIYSVINE